MAQPHLVPRLLRRVSWHCWIFLLMAVVGVTAHAQPTTLRMLSPNGGEQWVVDTTYRVRASVFNVTGLLTFEYSTDSMATWNLIDTMTAKNGTDTVFWKIPNVLTTNAFVRVSNADGSRRDTTNGRFSIVSEPPKTVRVLTPNGGQLYRVDSNAFIRWTSSNIPSGTFNIYYSADSARTWKSVGSKAVQSGLDSIAWKIPNDTTYNAFVRVVLAEDSVIRDASDARFAIRLQITPSITVIYPNGGESFKPDSVIVVQWKAQDFNGNLSIQYSVDSMATWQNLGNRQVRQGVVDTLSWRVPNLPTTTAFVRVSQAIGGGGGGGATAIRDTSNRSFTIAKLPDSLAPKITVTYPNGGQVLKADTTVLISWNAERVNGAISVQYSADNGTTWTTIANRQGRDGDDTASWRVPNSPTTEALVRVGSATITRDTSDGTFTILARPDSLNPKLKLLYPNGGEVLQTDSIVTVSWESKNITGNVTIQYAVNGGQWKNVATQATQEGPNGYRWKVPNDPSTSVWMRITTGGGGGGGGTAVRDSSDAVFTIQSGPAAEVTLIEPRVGRRLVGGTKTWIVWTSLNTGGTLLLEYSLDGKGTWKEIQAVQAIGARDSIEWVVPPDTTTRGWVRLRTFDNSAEYAIGPITILPSGTTGVNEAAAGAMSSLAILPNPAASQAALHWQQKQAGDVTARLYASDGSLVATTPLGNRSAGAQQWQMNVSTLQQGSYLLRLQSPGGWVEERVVVVR